jgi:hypothetical protein
MRSKAIRFVLRMLVSRNHRLRCSDAMRCRPGPAGRGGLTEWPGPGPGASLSAVARGAPVTSHCASWRGHGATASKVGARARPGPNLGPWPGVTVQLPGLATDWSGHRERCCGCPTLQVVFEKKSFGSFGYQADIRILAYTCISMSVPLVPQPGTVTVT